jgi:hypothetical protein
MWMVSFICVRIIHSNEFDAGIHQSGHECQVAGQPIELGDYEFGLLLFTAPTDQGKKSRSLLSGLCG